MDMVLIGDAPVGSAKRPSYGFLPGVPGKRREPPGERIGEPVERIGEPGERVGERWGDPGDRVGDGDAFAGESSTPGRP